MKKALLPFMVALLGAVALGTSVVQAEVSALVDRDGNYILTVVEPVNGEIWTPRWQRVVRLGRALNPDGNAYGDLWPTVGSSDVGDGHPWVVWSRAIGSGYDLVYSRWTDRGWTPIRWIGLESQYGDDLGPALGFDREGRPFMAWWKDEGGSGKIFVSVYLSQAWMAPFLVSDVTIDSRHPMIRVTHEDESAERNVQVQYETPDGRVGQTVTFTLPVTITDDINPMGIIHVGSPIAVQESSH